MSVLCSPRLALAAGVALLGSALLARVLLSADVPAMWIYSDEASYAKLAASVVDDGLFGTIGEAWDRFGSFLYPLLLSFAWLVDDTPTTYAIAKGINVGLMTAGAAIAYAWARRLVTPGWALVAAVLALALPSFVYSTALITDNAFFPAFLGAVYAIARTLEHPSWWRQVLVLVLIGIAYVIRVQGLVLLPILATALAGAGVLEWRASPAPLRSVARTLARRYAVWVVVLPLVAIAYLAVRIAGGAGGTGLGVYSAAAATGNYSARDAVLWVFWSFGELSLSVAIVPMAALVVLVGLVAAGRLTGQREVVFVTVAASAVAWVVVQVGVFSSRFAFDRVVQERSMFGVAPLLVLALVLWLARGAPRPRILAPVAVAASAAAALALPIEQMLPVSGNHAFGLYSLWVLAQEVPISFDEIRAVLGAFALVAAALFALRRRLARIVVPLALAAFLCLSSLLVFHDVSVQASNQRGLGGIGEQPDWIDARVGAGDAYLIYTSSPNPLSQFITFLQVDFWNRSIHAEGILQGDTYRAADLTFDALTGAIRPLDPGATIPALPYAVAASDVILQGELVEARPPLGLYRVEQPLRLASSVVGRYPDGWIGAEAGFTQWEQPDVPGGNMIVELSLAAWTGPSFPDVPRSVTVTIAPLRPGADGAPVVGEVMAQESWEGHKEQSTVVVLPAPPPPFYVRVTATPVVAPNQFGVPDDRALGVQVRFRYAS